MKNGGGAVELGLGTVSGGVDEDGELGVSDRRGGDAEGRDGNLVDGGFAVGRVALVKGVAHGKGASRDEGIAVRECLGLRLVGTRRWRDAQGEDLRGGRDACDVMDVAISTFGTATTGHGLTLTRGIADTSTSLCTVGH